MVEMKRCRVCNSPSLIEFISFGRMPVANAFVKREALNLREYTYNMAVGFCRECSMVQLMEIVPYEKYIIPTSGGKTEYAFFSSTSSFMEKHFAELAKEVEDKFLSDNKRVLEVGSNDGIMLKAFANRRNVLGVEPSYNVGEVARKQGIETLTEFFSGELARKIVWERGKFRAVLSTNVTLNIINLNDFFEGIDILLDEKGVFISEDPYIVDILDKVAYDQIYDEHIWYFSLSSLSNILARHNLEIFDAEKQWVHGGSMRVYICKKGAYPRSRRVIEYLEEENKKKIGFLEPYLEFAKNAEKSKQELRTLLTGLKSKGKKIIGYAAASKGTIVLNYCDIGPEIIDYISDSTPIKQGLFSPGKHIPIVSPEVFHKDNKADYALLSAWNHAEEIMQKEKDFLERGGRFIVHYPRARILEPSIKMGKSKFEGIELKELKVYANDQGYLFETVRADDKMFDGKFGQSVVSVLYPGTIKGLHKHKKQTDYTACIKGNIKYIVASEKNGKVEIETFTLGEKNNSLIKVPPGYWHGYMPLANQEAIVLHLMDKVYSPEDDDTERKDAFAFGDVWTVKPS